MATILLHTEAMRPGNTQKEVLPSPKIVRVIVRELGTKAFYASRKQRMLFADLFGSYPLLLFAVVPEIRLRTRRLGVRISQGAPFS